MPAIRHSANARSGPQAALPGSGIEASGTYVRLLGVCPAGQLSGEGADRFDALSRVGGVEEAADEGGADDHPVGEGGHLTRLLAGADTQADGGRQGGVL